ncbi:MAG TPA: STAS/SEC14 domain-containing protein [Thermoanaerobaculia bacterium]|jgi:hypothetical protein
MATALMSADDVLRAIQRLDVRDIEQLIPRILLLKAERSALSLPADETGLLARINEGLPEREASRYHELMDKRRAGSLIAEEHRELLRLSDAAEAIQARRVHDLAELARLRGTSLSALVGELGLQPSPDA